MAKTIKTPGVYITESTISPDTVIEVATSIPAFIGYTETASRNGNSLLNKPTRITSFEEYVVCFGGTFNPTFKILDREIDMVVWEATAKKLVFTLNDREKAIVYNDHSEFYMYRSLQLFFANGGGTCYIVSVGTFGAQDGIEIRKKSLLGETEDRGLKTLLKEQEPTMIVIPDAVTLTTDDCYAVYRDVLSHCAQMQNRVAILDVYDGFEALNVKNQDVIEIFRNHIGTQFLSYAAAYYPWLHTTIVPNDTITFKNLDSSISLEDLLPQQEATALQLVADYKADVYEVISEMETARDEDFKMLLDLDVAAAVSEDGLTADAFLTAFAKAKKEKSIILKGHLLLFSLGGSLCNLPHISNLFREFLAYKEDLHHSGLLTTSPTYVSLLSEMTTLENLLPPSAAMAGLYTVVDNTRGVWKAPANISVNSVIQPSLIITHEDQERLNVDAITGKSINAIRTFPGVGTMVWGATTLDGNSLDWRYINVRRTIIMLEQSIKIALRAYVFEPNDVNTWVTVKSMIVNFLTEKWKLGALAGSSPDDAFSVDIGLGATMTSQDILEGKMLVSIKLAIVRPAEFIVVTFQQQMQKS